MAGTKNRISRQWLWRLTGTNAGNLLCVAMTLPSAVACSGLAKSDDTFCSTEGEGKPGCIDPSTTSAATEDWSCLGVNPPPLPMPGPGLVAFVQPVLDWFSQSPLAAKGLMATLCSSLNPECDMPLIARSPVQSGMLLGTPLPAVLAGVLVPDGFREFIKFEMPDAMGFVPEAYYLARPVSGSVSPVSQGPPLLMVTKALRAQILQQHFNDLTVDAVAGNGVIISGIYDCKGNPVANARVEMTVNGQKPAGAVPFLLPPSRIPLAQSDNTAPLYTTSEAGIAGFLNVPQGSVHVSAYRGDDAQPFGEVQLGSVAGQITVGPVRPPYLNSANLTGTPVQDNTAPSKTGN